MSSPETHTPYHLRRKEKEITDAAEIDGILTKGKFATLALADGTQPYCVTMNYGYSCAERILYFHAALAGRKLDIIRRNPLACATVIEDRGYSEGKCSHAFRSLVLFGRIQELEDPAAKTKALQLMVRQLESNPEPVLQKIFSADFDPQKVTVLKFSIEAITGKKSD